MATSSATSSLKALYTIGYEGITLDQYLDKLVEAEVELLCDVRRNPISRKPGFSKRRLEEALAGQGIAYMHLPELGIASAQRRNLRTSSDYAKLFASYARELGKQQELLARIMDSFSRYRAIALTCFERDHRSCHRHCVSDLLAKENGRLTVRHL